MYNFPTEDVVMAFEALGRDINQLIADIVEIVEPIMMTMHSGPSDMECRLKNTANLFGNAQKKSFKRYDYIPIAAKNLPYQRRTF